MIFDTIAALADFSDVDFDGDVTADEIVEKLIELRENGLLNSTFENLNIAGVKQSNTQTQELKHFVRNLLAQKRTGFSEVEADMIAERVYRTRMYNEGKTVREDLASSSSSSAVTSSSSSSSSSQYTGEDPGMLITLTWTDDDETKMFFGEIFTNGETKIFAPTEYATGTDEIPFGTRHTWREWWRFVWSTINYEGFTGSWINHTIRMFAWRGVGEGVLQDKFTGRMMGAANATSAYNYFRPFCVKNWGPPPTYTFNTNESYIFSYAPTESAIYFSPTTAEGGMMLDNMFGHITNTEGLTITWQRGPDGTSKAWKVNR